MSLTRRQCLERAVIAAGLSLAPRARLYAQTVPFERDPFSLGVASGYPTERSVVLWTRLAPAPLAPLGGMPPAAVAVEWEVAADERFTRIVAAGEAAADPELAHSVHVDVAGLEPAREYWYRFMSGGARSEAGRTKTMPASGSNVAEVRLGLACCQHYESAHYAAFAALADDELDLIVHVGDYIYENAGTSRVRSHDFAEAETLDDYRRRFALYKSDVLLQRAHASAPWVATWDDHEVDNDYAGSFSESDLDPAAFLRRRAAAYRAYYEHLPLPAAFAPRALEHRLRARQSFGGLVDIYLLDGRQYRSRQACGYGLVDPCAELAGASRTMLGFAQERWLADSIAEHAPRWTLLAQQTVFADLDQRAGPARGYWSDGWSGYPAARQRLIDTLVEQRAANPVILSGDLHAYLINDVHGRPGDLTSPVAATEIVTTSISSAGPPQSRLDGWRGENPNVRYALSERGYTRLSIRRERIDVDLIAVDDFARADSGVRRVAAWHVLDGRPGAVA